MTSYPPHSICWTPLGPISYLLPIVGHVGISNWKGDKLVDFSGRSKDIVNEMMGGPPQLWFVYRKFEEGMGINGKEGDGDKWDESLDFYTKKYKDERIVHHLLKENCHHFVANIINRYNGNHSMRALSVYWMLILYSKPLGLKLKYLFYFILSWSFILTIIVGLVFYNKK